MAGALPGDWPFALRSALEIVLGGWLLVVTVTMAVYVSTSSMDAAAALSAGAALRAGTGLWALAFGGSYGSPADANGELGLPLLGMTALQWLLTLSSVRRAKLSGLASGALLVVACAVLSGVIVLVASPADSATWPAILGLCALTAVVAFTWLQRRGLGWQALTRAWERRPVWVSPALVMLRDSALVLMTASVVVLVLAAWDGAARVTRLHDMLLGGGVVAAAGLVLLQLGWLPTVAVWALSWLVGPGFVVGQGTTFAPDYVVAGAVPTLPLLGLLPSSPLGGEGSHWGAVLPLILTVASMLVAWRIRRRLAPLRLAHVVLAACAAAVMLSAAVTLACVAASGPIGPGRLDVTGPVMPLTVALVALEVGVGLLAGAVISHPVTRRATERGVRRAGVAGASAADRAKNRLAEVRGRGGDLGKPEEADMKPARLVVLVSGTGSNLKALLAACDDPSYGATIVGVVADKDCPGLAYARGAGVPCAVVSLKDFDSRSQWDEAVAQAVAAWDPQLIVCAGFMRILGAPFLSRFEGKVINTHPSLLPNFPGAHAVRDALAAGATRTGATLFWVDAGVDTGAHIAQVEVPVMPGDTEESLTARVKAAETPQLVEQVGCLSREIAARAH